MNGFAHEAPTDLKMGAKVPIPSDQVKHISSTGQRQRDAKFVINPPPVKGLSSAPSPVPDDGLSFAFAPIDGEPKASEDVDKGTEHFFDMGIEDLGAARHEHQAFVINKGGFNDVFALGAVIVDPGVLVPDRAARRRSEDKDNPCALEPRPSRCCGNVQRSCTQK